MNKKKVRILLLEDSESDAELISRELNRSDLKIILKHVGTRKNYLNCLLTFKPDLIILDYMLPEFNGMKALTYAKKILQTIPCIIVTGSINEETAVECMKAGADDYVLKDHIIRLVPAVIEALRKKEVLKEKKILRNKVAQLQKMRAICTLTGGIAHDFNNVLCGIKGFTDLILMDIEKEHPVYTDLKKIQSTTEYGTALINQLLIFTQQKHLDEKIINLNNIIDDLSAMLKRLIGDEINLITDLNRQLWDIRSDESNIKQIIINLILNARDAMQRGGEVLISTENVDINRSNYNNRVLLKNGRYVCFTISDTGIGMSNETLSRIYEPFFSLKDKSGGQGLGLSVVYSIVKQNKGSIDVITEPGAGTEIKIYLPAYFQDNIIDNKIISRISGARERILVIEDEKFIRESARRILEKNGYTVFESIDAQEALKVFYEENCDFELIISDTVLPDIDGFELAEEFIKCNPEIRILFCSELNADRIELNKIKRNGYRFIQKPYGKNELIKTVRNMLNPNYLKKI